MLHKFYFCMVMGMGNSPIYWPAGASSDETASHCHSEFRERPGKLCSRPGSTNSETPVAILQTYAVGPSRKQALHERMIFDGQFHECLIHQINIAASPHSKMQERDQQIPDALGCTRLSRRAGSSRWTAREKQLRSVPRDPRDHWGAAEKSDPSKGNQCD